MGVSLHFLGVGKGESVRDTLSEAGFLVVSDKARILVDPGRGVMDALSQAKVREVTDIVMTAGSDISDAQSVKVKGKSGAVINRHQWGVVIRLPDARIAYVIDSARPEEVKSCDVLVLVRTVESLIEKVKPKLAILTGFDLQEWEANPVYAARDIKVKTGVQTIAAEDGLVVDLMSYGAVSEQKSLGKF